MTKHEHQQLIATGILGLIAALVVGAGEFLLHFDPLARFSSDSYQFMLAASDERQTVGHFLGVLGAPLYVAGCWHIYLMLKPANQKWAFVGFVVGAYGFMIGADWISSRASIGAIVHLQQEVPAVDSLIALYDQRYESLLSIVRVTTLLLSLIFVVLTLSGRSYYAKWQALFNPIVLLLASFAIYQLAPDVGKYLMPIALNVAFGIFFLLSILQVRSINKE